MFKYLFGESLEQKYRNQYYVDEEDFIDIVYKNDDLIYSSTNKYQDIDVYKNKFFGNILVIDNDIQLTELDEENYHEMISHVPLNYLPEAENVLIIGGGDGGTLREVCRHPNLKKVIMIEIDKEVIDVAKEYFKKCSSAYNDERLELIIGDGSKWVSNNIDKYKNFFDLVIIDSTDYNTAITLFTDKFYKNIYKLLKKEGILTFNCMGLSWDPDDYYDVMNDMKKIFKYCYLYQVFIPTYASGHYSFCFCSNFIDPINTPFDIEAFNRKNIKCNYYNPDVHLGSFALPNKFLRNEKKERLGTSYMIDVKNCEFSKLDNLELMNKLLNDIVNAFKLTIVGKSENKFEPQGVSINILLSESHLTIHTWPEKGKCTIDLFTCSRFKWYFKKNIKGKMVTYDIRNTIIKHLGISKDDLKIKWTEREI